MSETTVSPARKTSAADAARDFYAQFGITAKQLRAWANDNGLTVAANGRIHPDVYAAYATAHAA